MKRTQAQRSEATILIDSSTSTQAGRLTDSVTRYAKDVAAERVIACKLVKRACERHLKDLQDGPKRGLRFDISAAEFAVSFFSFLRHTKGELAGQRVKLEPWQRFVVGSIFGWKRADGWRRFRTCYNELPKKSGKSTMCAGLALYGLVADNEIGAEIYATATKRDQARIVFEVAKAMVRNSPELARKINRFKLNLSVDRTGSKFEPLSSDEKSADGLNPSMVIVDELHRHKSAALRSLMDAGMVSRRQPLMVIITTAGDNSNTSAYAVENDYAMKVIEGTVEDDTYFAFIATIDDPKRWDDPGEWPKAQVNLGVSVKFDEISRLAAAARVSPSKKADFLRYHLNVRTSDVNRAIDMDLWTANAGEAIDVTALKGRDCYLAVDVSSRQDITASVKVFPPIAGEERWIIVPRFFTPSETIDERGKRDRAHYRLWTDQGYMEATPGNAVDQDRLKATIIEDAAMFNVLSLPFDSWNSGKLMTELMEMNLPVVEFRQGLKSFNAPTKALIDLLADKKIRHGANPVLTWMASNLMVQKDKNDNWMPHKAHSTGRIDGIVAAIMALGVAMNAPKPVVSFWETRAAL